MCDNDKSVIFRCILVNLAQFQKKPNAYFFDKSRFVYFTNASSLFLFGFFCFMIALSLENSIALDELVEEVLKRQLKVTLRRPTSCFSVDKMLIGTGHLILPSFNFCRLTAIFAILGKKTLLRYGRYFKDKPSHMILSKVNLLPRELF